MFGPFVFFFAKQQELRMTVAKPIQPGLADQISSTIGVITVTSCTDIHGHHIQWLW